MQPLMYGIGFFVFVAVLFFVFHWTGKFSTKPENQKARKNG